MPTRSALITGVTGQDGSYLAELLVLKGYRVFGLLRRSGSPNLAHLDSVREEVEILHGDLTDQTSLDKAVKHASPDEVYNLAAQSFVGTSFAQPVLTGEVTGLGVLRLLEAVRSHAPEARVFQAASNEVFGLAETEPQSESTPFHPRSPYGVAKVYAYWAAVNYREAYSMLVSNGILFNHESPRRGLESVMRKICRGAARIALGEPHSIALGTLDARRDWGYAPEYVELMWRMLQHVPARDYVGATGESHSVQELVEEAFRVAGVDDWSSHVVSDPLSKRPSDVYKYRGDSSRAERELGWRPETRFRKLVKIMVEAELRQLSE